VNAALGAGPREPLRANRAREVPHRSSTDDVLRGQHVPAARAKASFPKPCVVTRESAGSGFDPRLVCFGGPAPSQCSPTSSARLNPSLVRAETARGVDLAAAPRGQRRPRRSSVLRRPSRSNVLAHVGRTQLRAAAPHGMVTRRERQGGREGGRDVPMSSPPGNQEFSGAWGSWWLPPWPVSAQLRVGRQGREADRENSLPPRPPPWLGPCNSL
jgi:hypothetical protein